MGETREPMGFIDNTFHGIERPAHRIVALEIVGEPLLMLHEDGTLLDEELHELEERLG